MDSNVIRIDLWVGGRSRNVRLRKDLCQRKCLGMDIFAQCIVLQFVSLNSNNVSGCDILKKTPENFLVEDLQTNKKEWSTKMKQTQT